MSETESEQSAMAKNFNKRTLATDDEDEDSKNKRSKTENPEFERTEEEETLKEEDDALLPLTCSFCKEHFSDPIVTNCNHYFCKNCALKHHEKNDKCFACEEPTLGVFNTAVEIKKKIAKEREKAKGV